MVEVVFHRLFQKDLSSALRYYDGEGGRQLGDRFFEDVENTVARVTAHPSRFHFIAEGVRRAPLRTFPYHVVFEDNPTRLKFLVLRHDKLHPGVGIRRR
jgi:hypothetical protein